MSSEGLSQADLEGMRETELLFLTPDRCAIIRDTYEYTDTGGRTKVDGTPVPVACDFYPSSSPATDESDIGGAIQQFSTWDVILPFDTDVQLEDVILYPNPDGNRYEITSFNTDDEYSSGITVQVIRERN